MCNNPFEEWQRETDKACSPTSYSYDENDKSPNGDESGCCWIVLAVLVPSMVGIFKVIGNVIA